MSPGLCRVSYPFLCEAICRISFFTHFSLFCPQQAYFCILGQQTEVSAGFTIFCFLPHNYYCCERERVCPIKSDFYFITISIVFFSTLLGCKLSGLSGVAHLIVMQIHKPRDSQGCRWYRTEQVSETENGD